MSTQRKIHMNIKIDAENYLINFFHLLINFKRKTILRILGTENIFTHNGKDIQKCTVKIILDDEIMKSFPLHCTETMMLTMSTFI